MKPSAALDDHDDAGAWSATPPVDRAYDLILQAIIDGTYASGEGLSVERLAEQLHLSESSVREAIGRLESNGYVKVSRHAGATVRWIDLDLYTETVEAVALLESVALGLAVPNLTTNDLRRAREVNDQLRACLDEFDPTQYARLNRRFHEILFGACLNRHILVILEREWALLESTRGSAVGLLPERAAERVSEHDVLLDMIEQHRAIHDIEQYALAHRMGSPQCLLQNLRDLLDASTTSVA